MPIYEFYCPDNHKIYSFFARNLALADKTPRCPDNPKFRLERIMSSFAVTHPYIVRQQGPPRGGPDVDDPRMDAAMAEMEREFGGMNEENPDPRQLARMMRKMSALTGEKMPGQMEEMIRRMESGEDPEKLEEEYGDAIDDFAPGDEAGPGGDEDPASLKARLRRLRQRPKRDPKLYEMRDFVG